MARLLLDENVALSVAEHLDKEGHDVVTVREAGLEARSDAEVLGRAHREGRIVVTHDRDFAGVTRVPQPIPVGVVVVRCRDQRPSTVRKALDGLFASPASERLRGNLVVVTESEVRVHTRR